MSAPIQMGSVPPPTISVDSLTAPPRGYPQVATLMADYPEMAMVRRFRGLNARNLLYLQADLVHIEKELLKCERADADSKEEPMNLYAKDYYWLQRCAKGLEPETKQWKLVEEMRAKLKEYNDVLIQQTTLAQVPSPSKYDRKQVQAWFTRTDSGMGDMPIEGEAATIWGDPRQDEDEMPKYARDLVALNGPSDDIDRATNWLAETVVPWWGSKVIPNWKMKFPKWHSRSVKRGITRYRQSTLYDVTAITATMLASLLPVLSIVVLYLVKNMPARLGIIAGFTAGFSMALSLITSAARVDNFAATAAFAAVQVVFVGTSGNSTTGE